LDGYEGARRQLWQKLLSLASPLDLYGEEIDPHTGRQLGNFPQAFTHLALINAVMRVIRADQAERAWRHPATIPATPNL
jgi:alpha,alpha-trehalase